jgi:2-polyprenyl-3-methyl-5-hydroxy-6-metoxy-1,4-benzoquinol methylase
MAKDDERQYFDAIGDEGLAHSIGKPFSDQTNVGALLNNIAAVMTLLPPPPARLLDLGCGTGWTSEFFARIGYEVVGVDISQKAIDTARKHYKDMSNVRFELADFDELDFSDEFDAAVFIDSLHHTDAVKVTLQAAFKALKSGGMLIACEPGKGHSKHPNSVEAVKQYGVTERDMSPRIMGRALKQAGFTSIKSYAHPSLMHWVLYKKRSGLIGIIRSTAFVRGLSAFALATILRPQHGIVTAKKP